MEKVKAALLRSQTEIPQSVQVVQKGIDMYAGILAQIRAILAANPAHAERKILGVEIDALEQLIKFMEGFVASVTKHMEEWTAAHNAHGVHWEAGEHLRFLEDDFAKFVAIRERLEGERSMALGFLRPVWVEMFGPEATSPVAGEEVAAPVEEVAVVLKNRAERRALERAAKKGKKK